MTSAEDLLRSAALRVTRPRIAVLTAIQEAPHADVNTLVGMVRERLGAVSTQAVYDVLKALVDAGLARRIDLPGSAARYERAGVDHQHVICRSCGSISDVDGPAETYRAPVDHHGFTIDDVEVTYWGLCPDCQAANPA